MPADKFSSEIKQVAKYLQENNLEPAERLLLAMQDGWPNQAEVYNLVGVLNFKIGKYEQAAAAFSKYISIQPGNVQVLNNLALSYQQDQRIHLAKSTLQKAIKLDLANVDAYVNLMSIELTQSNNVGVIDIFNQANKSSPDKIKCNVIAAAAYKNIGNRNECRNLLKEYLNTFTGNIHALNNLANLEQEEGNFKEAKIIYENLVSKNPDFQEAKINLAITLEALNEFQRAEKLLQGVADNKENTAAEVILSNIYHRRGMHDIAISRLEKLVSKTQPCRDLLYEIGAHLYRAKSYSQAIDYLDQAISLGLTTEKLWNMKALCEKSLGNYEEAVNILKRCLTKNPSSEPFLNNLGRIYTELGDVKRGLKCFQRTYMNTPNRYVNSSNFLLNLHYDPETSPKELLKTSAEVGKLISESITQKYTSWPCLEKRDRISLAFFSPDFNKHPVGYLIKDVLLELKSRGVKIIAISNSTRVDEQTQRLKSIFDEWIDIKGLRPSIAAQKIYATGPHGLIDLAGYTDGGLMELFAYKSAPVQLEWLGYLSTTGLPEMDYFIADETTTNEQASKFFSEKLIRINGCHLGYSLPEIEIGTSEPPILKNGHVTFGSFNNPLKLNDKVLDVWSDILREVGSSVLRIQAKHTDRAFVCENIHRRFAEKGIMRDKIKFVSPKKSPSYFESYNEVDICLDTFPYPGGTITLDSIFMGVPVVTLKGHSHFSNNGVSILANVGHSDLVAEDYDQYKGIAIGLSNNLEKLKSLKKGLRESLMASPVSDPRIVVDSMVSAVTRDINRMAR